MLYLGYEIALPPRGEHALSVAIAMLRAALSVGVNLLPRGEHALPMAVAKLRAALPMAVKIM